MPAAKTRYVCTQCGYETAKWMGKCPDCGEWNTLEEEIVTVVPKTGLRAQPDAPVQVTSKPVRLLDVEQGEELRSRTGISEIDRVLGGGVVTGSLVLVGGDPGIGKSTLLMQVAANMAARERVLYISGEESARQVRMRAARLGTQGDMIFLAETNLDAILQHVGEIQPSMLVVDSIQTIYRPQMSSAPGSVSQVRESTARLMQLAKGEGVAVFLVGHVNKEGAIAGPRVLEHMVDTVLYLEGERHHSYRVLRAVKNRFGSTNEIGLFAMEEHGMVEVPNPSEAMLSGRAADAAGSAVFCSVEGSRPLLCEVQALVSGSLLASPRRTVTGTDNNRCAMLLAVLEKKVKLALYNQDVFVNVAGGLRIEEPAADLSIVAAIASGLQNTPLSPDMVVVGEVGLTGEIRAVTQPEKRLYEAARMGFKRCVLPAGNKGAIKKASIPEGVIVHYVGDVVSGLQVILG